VLFNGTAGGTTAAASGTTLGGVSASLVGTAATAGDGAAALTTAITLIAATGTSATGLLGNAQPTDGQTLTVNGHTITFKSGSAPAGTALPAGSGVLGNIVSDGNGNSSVYLGTTGTPTGTVGDLLTAIDLASGVQKAVINTSTGVAAFSNASGTNGAIAGGIVTLTTGTGADLSITGEADLLNALKLTTSVGGGNATVTKARTTAAGTLGTLIQDGSTLNINGKTVTFKNAEVPAAANVPAGSGFNGNVVTDGSGNSIVYLQDATLADTLTAIDLATGVKTAANSGGTATLTTVGTASSISASGVLQISTGTTADLSIVGTGNALSALGLTGNTGTSTNFTAGRSAAAGSLSGKTLTFTSFNGGSAVNVTFGDGTNGTVKTLDQLNASLLANNLAATVDSTGKLTISATNDYASSTLGSAAAGGAIGGTLTSAITFTTPTAPVVDASAQTIRSNLVSQFNGILSQITTTSQDASFNGVNLLGGDQLKLTFNETGKSTLNITGVTFNAAGLGLANLASGTDFIDNSATNKVIANLGSASTLLRTQASALGSNLSIVQIRQDFSKNLINVLQTGSSNLTLADTNEEAANSQALSTRQSIAVSALALANQSQQSVLQLLR
jgi:flagellin